MQLKIKRMRFARKPHAYRIATWTHSNLIAHHEISEPARRPEYGSYLRCVRQHTQRWQAANECPELLVLDQRMQTTRGAATVNSMLCLAWVCGRKGRPHQGSKEDTPNRHPCVKSLCPRPPIQCKANGTGRWLIAAGPQVRTRSTIPNGNPFCVIIGCLTCRACQSYSTRWYATCPKHGLPLFVPAPNPATVAHQRLQILLSWRW
jgi:hypothetical protein